MDEHNLDLYRWYLMGFSMKQEFVWNDRKVANLSVLELAAFSLGVEHHNSVEQLLQRSSFIREVYNLLEISDVE